MQVKFGTDGWRAIIAKDYTYDNLKLAALASAQYFLTHPNRAKGVCIGYDTRFMSKDFARYTAEIFSSAGLKVYLSDSFVSTPAVSLFTKAKQRRRRHCHHRIAQPGKLQRLQGQVIIRRPGQSRGHQRNRELPTRH